MSSDGAATSTRSDLSMALSSGVLNINIGILGHVDSGKTSLVKALSTSLSTAALDKNPQSQQRGITLDLGFSAFNVPISESLPLNVRNELEQSGCSSIQFTLVDCPGMLLNLIKSNVNFTLTSCNYHSRLPLFIITL